jgi:N4-gp56 family major capsid protein
MAYSGTQYGDISPRVGIVAVANMLAYADEQIVLDKFAKIEAVPKNKGLVVRFRRPVPFEVNPLALVEGVTPAPQALEYEDVLSTALGFRSPTSSLTPTKIRT